MPTLPTFLQDLELDVRIGPEPVDRLHRRDWKGCDFAVLQRLLTAVSSSAMFSMMM